MSEEDLSHKGNEPWQSIANACDCEMLHREISRLPKRYRDVIVLCHLEGKSRSQTATILDVTTASVKASLVRGRKLLRKRLLRQGIAVSTAFGIAANLANTSFAGEVADSLIQSTLHHCQGLGPIEGIGNGPDFVNTLVAKETSMMMSIGITPTCLAIASCMLALSAMSLVGIAQEQDPTTEVVDKSVSANEFTLSLIHI